MGEKEKSSGTSRFRASRWFGTMSTVGAIGAVLVMVLAPAAVASSAAIGFSHDTEILDYSANIQGCAHASNTVHKFSMKNGVGQAAEKASAITCSKAKGGFAV